MITEAHRNHIYKFNNGNIEGSRYVIVIGDDRRATDKMISILMLGQTGIGHDVVKVAVPGEPELFFAHCGMVTYTKRDFLYDEVGVVDDATMERIDRRIATELSLLSGVVEEARFYKTAYNALLEKVGER